MTRPRDLTLLERYDALLFDLDGTVMHGARPIPHAAEAIRSAHRAGVATGYVTNNASRTPQQVVEHLALVDVEARPDEVSTSPQVALHLLLGHLAPPATILVLGGDGLRHEVASAGFDMTREDRDDVAAVIQGFAPTLGWEDLAEAAYALHRGVPWVATNTDATLPTERGFAPGNGSLVALLRHATGRSPLVAGKPAPAMFTRAAEQLDVRRPLAVGDRLDTDIEGGNRAGMHTLQVLTGVDDLAAAVYAAPVRRPRWILPDLSWIDVPLPDAVVGEHGARCGRASARLDGDDLVLGGEPNDPRTLRAAMAVLDAQRPDSAFVGRVVDREGTVLQRPAPS